MLLSLPLRLHHRHQQQGRDQGRWVICHHLTCLAALLLGTLTLVLIWSSGSISFRTVPSTLIWCRPFHYYISLFPVGVRSVEHRKILSIRSTPTQPQCCSFGVGLVSSVFSSAPISHHPALPFPRPTPFLPSP